MKSGLQLQDYSEGYRFRVKCHACGYGWYEDPLNMLSYAHAHAHMYIPEAEALLTCRACRTSNARITPLLIRPKHHFTGGIV